MFDVLVYLFENYYQAEGYPDQDTLSRKLHAAGFENEDISEALDWLNGLARFNDNVLPPTLETSASQRAYTNNELDKLSTEGRGFLVFLESARVLSPVLREVILERAMALPEALDCRRTLAARRTWRRNLAPCNVIPCQSAQIALIILRFCGAVCIRRI